MGGRSADLRRQAGSKGAREPGQAQFKMNGSQACKLGKGSQACGLGSEVERHEAPIQERVAIASRAWKYLSETFANLVLIESEKSCVGALLSDAGIQARERE
eukprot:1560607-Pleurochrysis_carterae.AAC.1